MKPEHPTSKAFTVSLRYDSDSAAMAGCPCGTLQRMSMDVVHVNAREEAIEAAKKKHIGYFETLREVQVIEH